MNVPFYHIQYYQDHPESEKSEPGAKKSRAFFHSFKYWSDRRDNRAELQNCPKIDPKLKTKMNNRLSQNFGNLDASKMTLEDKLAQMSTPKIRVPKGDIDPSKMTLEDRLTQMSTPKIRVPKGDKKVSYFML